MSNFVVSARKYRPIRFDSVVGQQHVSQTLKNAIKSDHLAQAFLFCGPRGVGKTTCARILAKVLNCQSPTEDMEPCDSCSSCESFNQNASLNIHELDAASNNSVDHIRSLIEQVRFAPQSGRYKIYIIDEVHMLSQAAFNAFLKTLEEPPSYAIFILATTEKHKIIPTILSRCQIFDFNRIQVPDMVAHLQSICKTEGIKAEEDALNIVAQKADGALRDALSIFDRIVSFSGDDIRYDDVIENLNILDYDYFFKIVDAMASEDVGQLLLLFDKILRKGFDGDIFMTGLAEHLRNLLVCQDKGTVQLLEVSGTIRNRYMEQAQLIPTSLILSALSIANECDVNYKLARNKRLHIEMAIIRMAYIQRALQASQLSLTGEKKNEEDNLDEEIEEKQVGEADLVGESGINYKKTEFEKVEKESGAIASAASDEVKEAEIPTKKEPEVAKEAEKPAKKPSIKEKLKATGGLLSKLAKDVKEEAEAPVEEAIPFTIENTMQIWEQHWQTFDSPSSQTIYRSAKLSIEGPTTLKILVSGSRAKDEVFRDTVFLNLLKTKFQINEFVIDVQIDESTIKKAEKPKNLKPVTDRDKYVHFLKLNPLLKDFQQRFGLFPEK